MIWERRGIVIEDSDFGGRLEDDPLLAKCTQSIGMQIAPVGPMKQTTTPFPLQRRIRDARAVMSGSPLSVPAFTAGGEGTLSARGRLALPEMERRSRSASGCLRG
jgi:hypothetical protein